MVFSIQGELCTHPLINLGHFHYAQKKLYPLAVTHHFHSSPHPFTPPNSRQLLIYLLFLWICLF